MFKFNIFADGNPCNKCVYVLHVYIINMKCVSFQIICDRVMDASYELKNQILNRLKCMLLKFTLCLMP